MPPVGSGVADVRLAQYEKNRAMLRSYAAMAREAHFTGLFCQISDPVDPLACAVFRESNRNAAGEFDGCGLLPEQVQGFGLGVMEARARWCARRRTASTSRTAVSTALTAADLSQQTTPQHTTKRSPPG